MGVIHGRERERRPVRAVCSGTPAQLLLQEWSVQAALRLSCPRHGRRWALASTPVRPCACDQEGAPSSGPWEGDVQLLPPSSQTTHLPL